MSKFFSKAYRKFQQDAPSILIYDVLKGTGLLVLGGIITALIPDKFIFKRWLASETCQSIYVLIITLTCVAFGAALLMLLLTRKKIKRLEFDADRDELTGLKNGKALLQQLNKSMVEAQKKELPLSLIIIDIDDFKRFNTLYGHPAADEVIKKVGELLASDKRATDELFRQFQKGDEFIIIANNTNLAHARKAAERKRILIEQTHLEIGSDMNKVTVSCGIVEFRKGADTADIILGRASHALALGKSNGKNCTEATA